MKTHRVKFVFDERSLESIEKLRKQDPSKYGEITVRETVGSKAVERVIVIPNLAEKGQGAT